MLAVPVAFLVITATLKGFDRNLERAAKNREHLLEEIRTTLYHELGHVLGFDEEGVAQMGLE